MGPRTVVLSLLAAFILLPVAHAGLVSMSLKDVYSLPTAELESLVLADLKVHCSNLTTSDSNPAQLSPAQLSPAQLCAVQHYSNSGFGVNRRLWDVKADGLALTGEDWAYVRVLDSALAKMKSAPRAKYFRGTSKREFPTPKKNDVVRLKGYASTSSKREVAEGFLGDRLLIIQSGSTRSLKAYSNAGMEDEFLLPRSSRIRIDRVVTKKLEIFTEEGPEVRDVEIIEGTQVE